MVEKEKLMIMRLQDNLSTIRKLAGWTTQELGDKIGVTKQTISNLENKKSTMTKLQYIGLRSILDMEANSDSENADLLKMAMKKLLDEELTTEEQEEYEGKMAIAAAAIAGGADASAVKKQVIVEYKSPGVCGAVAKGVMDVATLGAVALASPVGLPVYAAAKWLNKLMEDD